ncbi:hypothetical protein [Acidovorax sp.]|uniref:hypothetical protein n=1 Tax=Acidovorax sp. TaxID=1872122 RepID=UPI003D008F29
MYYIERNPITDATFLAGSVAEPATGETVWATNTAYALGVEVIRPTLHRVFKAAVAITADPGNKPPEEEPTKWKDMRATKRHLPFGPAIRADRKRVYQSLALTSTTEDLHLNLAMRYVNALALFGLRGALWRVQVYTKPVALGGVLAKEFSGRIRSSATGYWQYGFGQRFERDRVLVTGLPIFPNAEVRISVEGSGDQVRALSQCEVGKLRFIPGDWGGVLAGLRRTPRVISESKQDADGSTAVLIYGNTYDMRGTVVLKGQQEDAALTQLRGLLLKGVAFKPTLAPGFEQSLAFGLLKSADTERASLGRSEVQIDIEGLPT